MENKMNIEEKIAQYIFEQHYQNPPNTKLWNEMSEHNSIKIDCLNEANTILDKLAYKQLYEVLKDMMGRQEIIDGRVVARAAPSSESILKAQKALNKAEGKT